MRLGPNTDGRSHLALTVAVGDHHPRPTVVTISNTSQAIAAGADYNLDIALGSSDYQLARVQILGPKIVGAGLWRECASVHATRTSAQAIGHTVRDAGVANKVYSSTYSKQAGAAMLTHKIFDSVTTTGADYIALKDAVMTGSVLRLTFHNYDGSSRTLWVKGEALVW
jgi:hypothetical protein